MKGTNLVLVLLIAVLAAAGLVLWGCGSSGGGGGDDDSGSGDDDSGNGDDDSGNTAYCTEICQQCSTCNFLGPDGNCGKDLNDCIYGSGEQGTGCVNAMSPSMEACANNCHISDGCETWWACVYNCVQAG
jgi:hypothetical protein